LQINHRKLLIPIIFGGVFTPLTAVGYFQGFFHPVVALVFIIAGIFGFYLGWTGQEVLTVREMGSHTDFPLLHAGDNIRAFVEFTNQYIDHEPVEQRALYLPAGYDDASEAFRNPPLTLFTFRQMREYLSSGGTGKVSLIWVIDPVQTGSQIKYERIPGQTGLRPVLKGKISPSAIIKKYRVDEFMAISTENKFN
jgi:hypothetical protein